MISDNKDYIKYNSQNKSISASAAIPAEGYEFEKWIVTSDETRTAVSTEPAFTPIKGDDGKFASGSYTAVFKKIVCEITVNVTDNKGGAINHPSDTVNVECGEKLPTFTFIPDEGYE